MNAAGRRIAEQPKSGRGLDLVTVLGAVAVVIALVALALQAAPHAQEQRGDQAPATRPVGRVDLACPAPAEKAKQITVVSAPVDPGTQGQVRTRPVGADAWTDLELGGEGGLRFEASDPQSVQGLDDAAPGLMAGRVAGDGSSARECAAPAEGYWFTGAGAAGLDSSDLVVVNPDSGPAVVEIEIWTTDGPATNLPSRGLSVPGNSRSVIDLDEFAPDPAELAVHVAVVRGRVIASMSHRVEPATGAPVTDQLPVGSTPARTLIIPALHRTTSERKLVLANPGDDAGRVKVEVVGKRSAFAPQGLDSIQVPAGRVVTTDLGEVLASLVKKEDVALRLTSTVPITAGLHSMANRDLVLQPGLAPESGRLGAVVASGGKSTLMVSAHKAGRITVEFLSADGTKGTPITRRVKPGVTVAFPVPAKTLGVVVDANSPVAAGIRGAGGGVSVMPLRPLPEEEQVPYVGPAAP